MGWRVTLRTVLIKKKTVTLKTEHFDGTKISSVRSHQEMKQMHFPLLMLSDGYIKSCSVSPNSKHSFLRYTSEQDLDLKT